MRTVRGSGVRGHLQCWWLFSDAACGVNVRDGGKRDSDDLFSCPHYSLKGPAVRSGANPKPSSNTAAQDALYSASVEGGKDSG